MISEKEVLSALKQAFNERCARNNRYSLRAFSRSMDISHSLMSQVLNGHRAPSASFRLKVAKHLDMAEKTMSAKKSKDKSLVDIGVASFEQIASWIHYALLSLTDLPDFDADPKWLANRLGVSLAQAKLAWRTLTDLGYVEQTKGRWVQKTPPFTVANKASSGTTLRFTRELLAKAQSALDHEPFPTRSFGSITFAMRECDIPLARERIRDFRRSLCKELESAGKPDRVYALTVNLFPLSYKTSHGDENA